MKSYLLIPLFAGALMPLSAYSQTQGVPFQQLQRQIDQVRDRVHTLETTSPNGKTCPQGQFVTGFTTVGTIICAAPTVTPPEPPPPPPPPAPIPEGLKLVLQQLLNGATGEDVPLQVPAQTVALTLGTLTYQPLRYDLGLGTVVIAQASPTTATFHVPVPLVSVDFAATLDPVIGSPISSDVTLTAVGEAQVQVSIVTTASGASRVGNVNALTLLPSSLSITGLEAFGSFASVIDFAIRSAGPAAMERELRNLLNQIVPQLPEWR